MSPSRRDREDGGLLSRAVARCLDRAEPWAGLAYRATGIAYANRRDLLTGAGAKIHGARWTPRDAFATVYASLNPHAALAEALGSYRDYGIPLAEAMPLVIVAIEVKVRRLLDLTRRSLRRSLGVTREQMLSARWPGDQDRGKEALTQAIGRAAWESGLEGLLVPSARLRSEHNLVLFPDRLEARDALRIQKVGSLPEPREG